MLYRKTSSVVNPLNSDRTAHVTRMMRSYEKSSIRREQNAIEAAGYSVMLFQQLITGLPCTCHLDAALDVLDGNGNLDPDLLKELSTTVVRDFGNNRVVGMTEYADIRQQSRRIEDVEDFVDFLDEDPDERTPEQESEDDDEEEMDLLEDGIRADSAFGSNCPICSRIGIVGGFSLHGGVRIVRATQHFTDYKNCAIDAQRSPFVVKSLSDETASIQASMILPKNPWQVQSIRLLDGYKETNAQVFEGSTEIVRPSDLLPFCDGREHTLTIRFNGSVTHFEIQMLTNSSPLKFDISNISRTVSYKSLNDLDAISVSVPPHVSTLRRGDVFYEKTSGQLWVFSSAEEVTSPYNSFGFTGSAERVKSEYEPYALFNPFLRDIPYIIQGIR